CPSVVVPYAQPGECLRRTAFPLGDEGVPDVPQILYADAAGEEPRRGEVAEPVEERDARSQLRLRLGRPGDVVEHGGALGRRAGDEGLAVAVGALVVEPGEPAAYGRLQVRVVTKHELTELRHTALGRASRALVLGKDQVHEHAHRFPLVGSELLRLVGRAAGERLARPRRCLAYRLGGPRERGRQRRGGDQSDDLTSIHVSHTRPRLPGPDRLGRGLAASPGPRGPP